MLTGGEKMKRGGGGWVGVGGGQISAGEMSGLRGDGWC